VLASPVGQRSREQLLPGTFHIPGAGLTTATTGTGNPTRCLSQHTLRMMQCVVCSELALVTQTRHRK